MLGKQLLRQTVRRGGRLGLLSGLLAALLAEGQVALASELDPGSGLLKPTDPSAIMIGFEDAAQLAALGVALTKLERASGGYASTLGGFVLLDFAASKNTWLLQAPELVPTAIDPLQALRAGPPRDARARPVTAREKAMVDRYRHMPRLSIPASHPRLADLRREEL